ncbi:hypothetical protein CLU79DRAFT_699985 [Phycomyces nitens]|nr:hypothetical protein CLU79DRAFT_699985 [Phycomyces nitens]
MATTFKAIEPIPTPIVTLDEHYLLADLAGRQDLPLVPREIHWDPNNDHTELLRCENLAQVLRYRVANNSLSRAMPAFTTVDSKGKETTSLTWEKLLARAEKVAKVIREKSDLKQGDRVALIYRKSEAIEFTIALFGCFLCGRVAVPINAADELAELAFVLNLSATRLVLTTEHNLKAFTKDMQARQVDFPKNIEWWKTNDFGSWYPSQKSSGYPDLKVPELAYIEYVKATNGELKGVAVTHKTLIAQCSLYKAATTETCATVNDQGEMVVEPMAGPQHPDVVVSYLEPRQQVGLVLSILCSVFSGSHTIFASAAIMETPAIWVYVLSKYNATIALADYPGLKLATKLYQAHPKEVQFVSKKVTPNLSELRLLMIDTLVVQPETNEFIAEKLLRPLGNTENPLHVVCPVASLPEHGGMLLSFRDYLGPAVLEEWMDEDEEPQDQDQDQAQEDYQPSSTRKMVSTLASGHSRDVWECVLDADALPTVAIVDPETTAICAADTIGEVWIDAPSVPGGFWGLPKHSSAIFHARPIMVQPDTLHPEIYDQEFLRTGLVGKLIGGRLVVFGAYEDRVRQQRLGEGLGSTEVHFASQLTETVAKSTRLESCVFFDVTLNSQNLPVLAFESAATREELPGLIDSVVDLVLGYNGLRLYATVVVAPNTLPRCMKNGRRYLHAMMTKRAFLSGQMNLRYLKMDVDRTVFGVATSDDPNLDIWRSYMAYEKGVSMGIISARPQPQHTGMEIIRSVMDERTDFDLSKFTNIIDLFIWRTSLNPEETAFTVLTQSNGSLPTKSYTWRKMSIKIATVANFLQKKLGLKRSQKVLLFIPFGLDFVIAIYACLSLGIIVVTCPPPDPDQHPQRIQDDVGSMFAALRDLSISYILTNTRAEDILKHKQVSPIVKQVLAQYRKANFKMPDQSSISKAPKFNKLLGKESGFMVQPEWLSDKAPALISVQYSADMRRVYTVLGHDTILAQCRTQKMTCQMKFQRSLVVASIYATYGLGLLHSAFCGVYVGCPTVTISDEDFYTNPLSYFELIQRYKAKDVCVSHPLLQYAMNRIGQTDLRRVVLHNVQNMMVTTDDRPKPVLHQHITRYLAITRLEKEAINTVYSHASNPMVTTRSYMLVEPISLFIDFAWLRQGIVRPLSPEEDTPGVLLHDSGIVPSNTMIAIVNPETQMLCPSNVIGEIWVASDSNIQTLYGLNEASHTARFEATISGADPRVKYMRTGDLGFLWNVQRQTGIQQTMIEEGQCLFVLGAISETIEVNRLLHFPADIENTIERCHPGIPVGGCHVFQAGSEVVVVAAVKAKEQALSAIPVIVNAVLEGHSFLVDTVVIVNSNQLPRSRYGDKLRGKTLASFVEKKL